MDVGAKLRSITILIALPKINSAVIDTCELLLNDIAKAYRDIGIPNNNSEYKELSSVVAHLRINNKE